MKEYRWVFISLLLVVAASFMAYQLFLSERERHRALEEPAPQEIDLESTLLEEQSSGERSVEIFFYNPGRLPGDRDFLRSRERTVFDVEDRTLLARQIVQSVLRPEEESEQESDSAGRTRVELRQLYLLEDGTAVVDLSVAVAPAGVLGELALIESITCSLLENLTEVKQVQFLVDGQSRTTLGAHVSLHRPFM